MNRTRIRIGLPILALALIVTVASAQERTVGTLINSEGAFGGYTLFGPISSKQVFLIDMEGRLVHQWETEYSPGSSVYLLESGDLLRPGNVGGTQGSFGVVAGTGGIIQRISWEGELLWEYRLADDSIRQHHDIQPLPNGNILVIAWKLIPRADAIAFGRSPSLLRGDLWSETILELRPIGSDDVEIVWEWNAHDHLIQDRNAELPNYGVVAEHPELIDVNYNSGRINSDWFHMNGISYNAEFDQIMLSVPAFDEIWVIDHSTTTEEAAGHTGGRQGKGGDLLYRWGNPVTYGAGTDADQRLFFQHNPTWIPSGMPGAGNILLYNNGAGRADGDYSTVDEIVPPVNDQGAYELIAGLPFGPEELSWRYVAEPPTDFYSANISSAERLPNGNTAVCEGATGRMFEVTPDGELVWEYVNPAGGNGTTVQGMEPTGNNVFRAERYAPDFPGFSGRDLTPGSFIERYESAVQDRRKESAGSITVVPNPVSGIGVVGINLRESGRVTAVITDVSGREVLRPLDDVPYAAGSVAIEADLSLLPGGVYFVRYRSSSGEQGRVRVVVY